MSLCQYSDLALHLQQAQSIAEFAVHKVLKDRCLHIRHSNCMQASLSANDVGDVIAMAGCKRTSARDALRLRPCLLLSCVLTNAGMEAVGAIIADVLPSCAWSSPVESVRQEPAGLLTFIIVHDMHSPGEASIHMVTQQAGSICIYMHGCGCVGVVPLSAGLAGLMTVGTCSLVQAQPQS